MNRLTPINGLLLIFFLLFIIAVRPSHAVIEQRDFATPQTEQRYKDLIAELRCLVCQNQNLADSDADLAKDLRRKTAEMLNQGLSDQEIRNFMRDRYGDFVLYKPPFNATTAILWLGPFIVLFGVVIGLIHHIKQRHSQDNSKTQSNRHRAEIQSILEQRDEP